MKSRTAKTVRHALVAAAAVAALVGLPAYANQAPTKGSTNIIIEPQSLASALQVFSEQSGLQVGFESQLAQGIQTQGTRGAKTPAQALAALLSGTGLEFAFVNEQTVVIREKGTAQALADTQAMRLAQVGSETPGDAASSGSGVAEPSPSQGEGQGEDGKQQTVEKTEEEQDPERAGIPEILVTGSAIKTLNMDIRRTRDDAQPYVVFDREEIERSGAVDLDEFFKYKLTMSADAVSDSQSSTTGGNRSRVNLRGLGASQTLILVDGHRVAGFANVDSISQPDLNGIPLAAIERIEVLPTTASGIYGGSATGGVINVVLRRDYTGVNTKLTYGNTFQSDAGTKRAEISGGLNFENGRSSIMFASAYSESNPLMMQERDLFLRGRSHVLANDPINSIFARFPPLAATPNIRSRSGVNLTLKDGTQLNSPITYIPKGYAGTATDGGAALVANAGQYNLDLANTAQNSGGGLHSLLNNPTFKSVMLTARRDFSDSMQLFIEFNGAENSGKYRTSGAPSSVIISASAPNNPFQQDIRVSIPAVGADGWLSTESASRRALVGAIFRLSSDWRAEADYTWSLSRSSYSSPGGVGSGVIADIQRGAIDVLRDPASLSSGFSQLVGAPNFGAPAEVTLHNASLRVGGVLPLSLPSGRIGLSALIEHRRELFADTVFSSNGRDTLIPSRSQVVQSVYFESRVPLLANMSAAHLLELQLAARLDDYKVKGATSFVDLSNPAPVTRTTLKSSSLDPTVALRYQPVPAMTLRGSFGTGYLPPAVNQVVPGRSVSSTLNLVDPRRGGEILGPVTIASGGNPDLKAEESESYSLGLILMPQRLEQLRLAADWTRIEKQNEITPIATFSQRDFDNEPVVPGLIVRGPIPDGEDPELYGVGPVTGIQGGLFNVAHLTMEAVDLAADYEQSFQRLGTFSIALNATRLVHLERQLTPVADTDDLVGVSVINGSDGGGLKWKANATATWRNEVGLEIGWISRFFDSYYLNIDHTEEIAQGSATVPSQIYHDIFARYRFGTNTVGRLSGVLSNSEIRLGVSNVFNKKPPIDVNASLNGLYSPWGDPRLSSYHLTIAKTFGGS